MDTETQPLIFGCPISSFIVLESACSATAVPACATADPVVYNADCCGSIESFGSSVGSCFLHNAPACLDTAAVFSSITGDLASASFTNPCAAYIGGGGAATPAAGGHSSSSAAETGTSGSGSSSSAGAAQTGSGSSSSSTAENTSAAGSGSKTTSAATSSSTGKSNSAGPAAASVGLGLKVYIGVALIGALGVLNL